MKMPSMPSTAAMASISAHAPRVSICTMTQVIVRDVVIAVHAAVAIGAGSDGDAANAARGISGGGYGLARFFRVLHEGNEQRARADIENALDDDGVVPRHAHDGLGGAVAMAWSCGSSPGISLGACSASSTIQSKPEPAMISVAMLLQRELQRPICCWPAAMAVLKVLGGRVDMG